MVCVPIGDQDRTTDLPGNATPDASHQPKLYWVALDQQGTKRYGAPADAEIMSELVF